MAWEKRNETRNRYLYRSYRTVNGKVRKEYLGKGDLAATASRLQEQAEAKRIAAAAAWNREKGREAEVTAALHDFCCESDALVHAVLTAAGYYSHRGEWRKRRACCQEDQEDQGV